MTVISTLITRYGTAHASDSLITVPQKDGTFKAVKDKQKSKIIKVKHFWGIISYFGLAKHDAHSWNTHDWLRKKATSASKYRSSERFAVAIKDDLNKELRKMRFSEPIQSGLGVHFTAYEWIDGFWIPELFFVCNFTDPSYKSVSNDGLHLGRETYHTIVRVPADLKHRKKRCRLAVHDYLQAGSNMLIYNNGDPEMFNIAANSIHGAYRMIAKRGKLRDSKDLKSYLDIARRPVELVSKAQEYFYKPEKRTVGGKPHDLGVIPGRDYYSTTGDNRL